MTRPFGFIFSLLCLVFLGCTASEDEQVAEFAGEERYEECDKEEADIRLDVNLSRTDTPSSVATFHFYLRKVNDLCYTYRGAHGQNSDGFTDAGAPWYEDTYFDLTDITLTHARFTFSYCSGEVGKEPDADLRIEALLSLTSPTRQEYGNGITVQSSIAQLKSTEQQN